MIEPATLETLVERTTQRPEYADSWYHLALALHSAGRTTEALEPIERSLQLNPSYLDAAVTHAFILGELGRTRDGYRAFRDLPTGCADHFDVVLACGCYCMRYGWKRTGLQQLYRALAMLPHAPYVQLTVAAALFELGADAHAHEVLGSASQQFDQLARVLQLPDFDAQLNDVQLYLSWENPFLKHVAILSAQHLKKQGQLREATAVLVRANANWPGHAPLMVEAGRVYALRAKVGRAQRWYQGAVFIDKNCHPAHNELGHLHLQLDNVSDAIDCFERAVLLRPLFPDYRYQLARARLAQGHYDLAAEDFRQILALNPKHGQAALQLATVTLLQDDPRQTVAVLRDSACESWNEARLLAAQAYAELEDLEGCASCLEALLEEEPEHGDAVEWLDAIDGELANREAEEREASEQTA